MEWFNKIKYRLFHAEFPWSNLFEAAFFSAFLYTFMEWLFIVTKPSFLSAVPIFQKIRIFLFTASVLSGMTMIAVTIVFGFNWVFSGKNIQKRLKNFAAFIPAIVFASLGLLLVDNFTYTIFHFGIVTTQGFTTFLYLSGYIFLIIYSFLKIRENVSLFDRLAARPTVRKRLIFMIIILMVASFMFNFDHPQTSYAENGPIAPNQNVRFPHIILITADGLNAEQMSAYGYQRDTTPRIKELAEKSLVAENAYNNSGNTMGSIFSIYTGKYPTETRTLYPPDILKGNDSYQHLPNILRRLGYYNVQYTYPRHADAIDRNLLSGFDEANGRLVRQNAIQKELNKYLQTDYAYFFYEIGNRITDRLRHIFFNKKMINQQDLFQGKNQKFDDQEKIDRVLELLKETKQPIFVHMHWMGTHGANFLPIHRTFSAGKDINNQILWDIDFYDDSIIDFDAGVGQIIDTLTELGIYDNTILIIGSDHSQAYYTHNRIPLIIHFPFDQNQQTIRENVQNMDIAPTMIDFLKLEKPNWMEGKSLLVGAIEERPIIGVGVGRNEEVEMGKVVAPVVKPPFYQFGFISVIYCDTWYRFDFNDYHWEKGTVAGHTGSCEGVTPMQDETAFQLMRDRLKKDGFDTSSLVQLPLMDKK